MKAVGIVQVTQLSREGQGENTSPGDRRTAAVIPAKAGISGGSQDQ